MHVTSASRTEAIVWQLLLDEHTPQRAELLENGVARHRIEALYPYHRYPLSRGLKAYLQSGRRVNLSVSQELQQKISTEATQLYWLLSPEQISEANSHFNRWWVPIYGIEQAIVDHRMITFNQVLTKQGACGSHREQAKQLISRLMWALLYAMEQPGDEADEHLALVVDTYLPELAAA